MENVSKINSFVAVNYGSGDSYGSGSGDSYGDGYGDGYGVKSINGKTVYIIDDVQTIITHIHGNIAKGFILQGDLTIKPCYIVKQGNLFAHGDTIQKAQEDLIAKLMDNMPTEERISEFYKKFPDKSKKYPARDFFTWHHNLTGSCEAGRTAFAKDHAIDIDNGAMTVTEFIELTKNAYGGDIIKQLAIMDKDGE